MTRSHTPPRLQVQQTAAPRDLLAVAARLPQPALVTSRGWQILAAEPLAELTELAHLDDLADRIGWREPLGVGPPFAGGAIGVVGDDLCPELLDLPADLWTQRPPVAPVQPLWFGVYDTAVCRSPAGEVLIVAADLPGFTTEPAERRIERWRRRLARPAHDEAMPPGVAALPPSLDRPRHRESVTEILELIAGGRLYQLNLTLQVRAAWPASGALLARRLWAATPGATHAAYLRLSSHDGGDVDVASVSPETFLRTDGRRVVTRPIKGTRPRGDAPATDALQRDGLLASAKDRAEHVMIVDLARNDLGRVCEVGTVRVPALAALEPHPTVWHLTSDVVGTLREDVTVGDLLRATFPCGSVTGAPKREAVRQTAALEPVRRGVYCGAIGMLSRGLDLSVAIRTAVVHDGVASYGTGGGIVADSDPDDEWSEAMDKAAAFFRAVGIPRPS